MTQDVRERMIAIQEFTRDRTAAIVGFDEFQTRNDIVGSGVFVRVNKRIFVATVAHIIDDGKHLPTAFMMLLSHHRPLNSVFKILGERRRGGKGDADEEWDLAVAEIPPVALERTSRIAIELPDIDSDWAPQSDSAVFVHGLSESRVYARDDGGNDYGEHGYGTLPIVDAEPVDATHRPHIDLFLQYPKDGTTYGDGTALVPPLSPVGLSGGGVWSMTSRRLVGLVVAAHPHQDWVKAVRISHWVALLKEYLTSA